jgi:hypothetical protein
MIVIYSGTDETVHFTITDANGAAVDLSTTTAVFRILDVGEYEIEAGETEGTGSAVVLGIDTAGLWGIYRYQVLVDDTVAEEGQCLIRRTIPSDTEVS